MRTGAIIFLGLLMLSATIFAAARARRDARRRRLRASPLPKRLKTGLERNFALYRRLPSDLRFASTD